MIVASGRGAAPTRLGSTARLAAYCLCCFGWGAPAAAQVGGDLLLVLPWVDEAPTPPTWEMLSAWCEELDLRAWRGDRVSGARVPLRVVGGTSIERPPVRAIDGLFISLLTPGERAALVQGRVLLLDRISSPAREIRGPGYHHSPTEYPGLREPPTEAQRRAEWNTAWRETNNRELTDDEWAEIWARERHERWVVERFGALRFRPGFRCGLVLSAELVDREGRPLTGRTVVYSTMPALDQNVYTAWDEISLVATGRAVPMPTPGHPAVVWIEEHQPTPPTIVFDTSGAHSLAELTERLSAWEPCGVEGAFADDQLFVSAGEYHISDLKHAIQLASGLVFGPAGNAGDGPLVLRPYPDAILRANQTPLDPELWMEMSQAAQGDDWILARFATTRDGTAERRVEWRDLNPDEQEWILARAGVARPVAGGTQVHPGRIDDTAAAQCVVELSLRAVWERGFYAEVEDELGRTIYWRAFAVQVGSRLEPG